MKLIPLLAFFTVMALSTRADAGDPENGCFGGSQYRGSQYQRWPVAEPAFEIPEASAEQEPTTVSVLKSARATIDHLFGAMDQSKLSPAAVADIVKVIKQLDSEIARAEGSRQ